MHFELMEPGSLIPCRVAWSTFRRLLGAHFGLPGGSFLLESPTNLRAHLSSSWNPVGLRTTHHMNCGGVVVGSLLCQAVPKIC